MTMKYSKRKNRLSARQKAHEEFLLSPPNDKRGQRAKSGGYKKPGSFKK